jgi:hypothetical protein
MGDDERAQQKEPNISISHRGWQQAELVQTAPLLGSHAVRVDRVLFLKIVTLTALVFFENVIASTSLAQRRP